MILDVRNPSLVRDIEILNSSVPALMCVGPTDRASTQCFVDLRYESKEPAPSYPSM